MGIVKPKFGDKWPENRCVHCGIEINPRPDEVWCLVSHRVPGFSPLDCLVIGHICEGCRSQDTDRPVISWAGIRRVWSIFGVSEDVQEQNMPLTNS